MKVYKNIRQDKKFIICSFYTSGEYYDSIFHDILFPSLKKYDLPYHVEEIESLGSYQLNTGMKPLFIEKMLITYPTIDVVWVDVDGEFKKYPSIFDNIPPEYDMSVVHIDMDKWHGTNKYNGEKQLHSGTAVFKATEKTLQVVRDWRARILIDPIFTWEQKHLQTSIERHSGLTVLELPHEYSYISTLPNGDKPKIKLDPVILHHQAGRRVNRNLETV